MKRNSALVIGVGAELGLGAALCRKIAANGYHVYVAGRTQAKLDIVTNGIASGGGSAESFAMDGTSEADIMRLFDRAMSPPDAIDVPSLVIYNVGNNRHVPFRDLTEAQMQDFLRSGPVGGFLVGREAARRLAPLGRGTMIFTGASASLRGKPGFAHFAAAKAGLRMVAQSMAREFGPLGLHVAHVVIDGGIDGERLHVSRPQAAAERGENGLLNVDAIAEAYWQLHLQHPSAWTHEIDLRPFKEPF
ncbi:SDR family NAD(P)-dependent oxidoreductase [Paraburkholderia hospita]|uniref:Glucose 1-dehydrogenase n=1 Tax=Paraburkholderia hospita TaxID=169430 RepID=A0AAN1JFD7_9BURK|nr:SDR family NAD(P)-dependent oxidoreductase [Paraburkholderia hospita]AUT72921.1 glucose 1-dehydrogenase [Paraburkholderia hospita]EIM99785.1 short-chain dehydrogenase/reductase SDR [Paraburkholderia hospita]OUL85782.1 glucose 1-dehydrogenase [Paraburkholderia hospita]OUL88537.1 glucose 1-dehydrogenase [Paraburkholderia hospita]SEH53220.1 NAD(P)-dependent dehydrogenase, short-chain alcohol dehydrogenase family [Paraburkholderia hospita]